MKGQALTANSGRSHRDSKKSEADGTLKALRICRLPQSPRFQEV